MKTGIIFGVFDLLHLGHLVMLEEAKKQCDYLIVALKSYRSDEEEGTVSQTLVERYIKLEGCQYVDNIVPYETDQDILDILQTVAVDICFVGEAAAKSDFPGREYCNREGVELVYTPQKHRFSSAALRSLVHQREMSKMLALDKKSTGAHAPN